MKKNLYITAFLLFFSYCLFAQGYSGLIGRWAFDGNANDVSGHGLNGVIHNATLVAGYAGTPNTAYQFNGTSSYIGIPYNSLLNTKVHSFCALVKPLGFYPGHAQGNAIIWRGNDMMSSFSYQLEFFDNAYDNSDATYSPTEDVFAGWTGATTSGTPQAAWYYTPTIVPNKWYSVVLTYDGDTTKIYVDGVQKTAFYNTSTFSGSTDSLFFGKSDCGPLYPYWLNGIIDEIRFYDRVLSPSEVLTFRDSLTSPKMLSLRFYHDANADCVKESTENYNNIPLAIQVNLNGTTIDTISATSGLDYLANGGIGDLYAFSILPNPGAYVSCPSSGIISDTLSTVPNGTKYVGLSCSATTGFDMEEHLVSSSTPTDQVLNILIGNNYCTSEPGTLTVNFSSKYNFLSAYPPPIIVAGSIGTWNFSDVSSITSPLKVHVTLVPAITLSSGETVTTNCTITPITGDLNTTNNIIVKTDTIRDSHDPNEISVTPDHCIQPGTATTLQFAISFENTGNDTAHNVCIKDTLSDNLDPQTLQIIAASNAMNVSYDVDMHNHSIYSFTFPDINLLDSSHHNECYGEVIYEIVSKASLTQGKTINSRAGIYFDNNPVVMTNEVKNEIGCNTTSIKTSISGGNSLNIYPNPVQNVLNISSAQTINTVLISNIQGEQVFSNNYAEKNIEININNLPAGFYFLRVNNSEYSKLIKL